MSSLYELTGQALMLQRMLEDNEIDLQTVLDTMESLNYEIEEKAENYAKIIRNLTSDIEGLKAEEARLYGRRKSLEGRITALKFNLEQSMNTLDKKSFKTQLFSFNIQKNPPKLVVDENAVIPNEFFVEQAPKLDTTTLKDAVKNGLEIEGVRLEQTEGLRIK